MKIIKKYVLPVLGISVLTVFIFWKLSANKGIMEQNAAIANQKMTVFPVTVVTSATETISNNFRVTGTFKPAHQLNFVSETAGRVVRLNRKNGDQVAAGQVIAQLDTTQVSIDLSLARANLQKAKADLEKYQTMLESNAVNRQQVEEAKMAVKNTESRVATLNRQLKLSTIVSPISGTINSLSLETGSYLAPGSMIAEIVDVQKLVMSANLLDREVIHLKNGDKVNLVPDLYPNNTLVGTVTYIASKADGAGKYTVEMELNNSTQTPLKAGMTGTAAFEPGGLQEANLLPLKCLVGSILDPKVYVVYGDSVQPVALKVGQIHGDKIEIVAGLSEKDQVVETGQTNLSPGSKIQVID
ncbi:MAG: efflux RND transporter periplasmic adaptor subunit [Bacteroidia bacterium]|nr:efflux RND transporter periplasmic adaptor subunit [Bacteroidia bacterium]